MGKRVTVVLIVLLVALLVALLPGLSSGSVPVEILHSRDGRFEVHASPRITPVQINRMHAWDLVLRHADGTPVTGARITVDGGMPAHDHGLPTRPRVSETADPGRYLLEGLRFHMHGEWRLSLRIEAGGARDVVDWRLQL